MQPELDFTAPVAPSSSPLARHCSSMGALHAQERIGRQCLALLTLYRQRGALTDMEAAHALGIERSTINARRNELVQRRLVQAVWTRRSEDTGISNTTWGLSQEGSMDDEQKTEPQDPPPTTSPQGDGDHGEQTPATDEAAGSGDANSDR